MQTLKLDSSLRLMLPQGCFPAEQTERQEQLLTAWQESLADFEARQRRGMCELYYGLSGCKLTFFYRDSGLCSLWLTRGRQVQKLEDVDFEGFRQAVLRRLGTV